MTLKAGNRPKYWKIFIDREEYSGVHYLLPDVKKSKQTPLYIFSRASVRMLSRLRAMLCHHRKIKLFACCLPCPMLESVVFVILTLNWPWLTRVCYNFLGYFFEGLGGSGDLEFLVLLLPQLYEWWLYGQVLLYLVCASLRWIPGSWESTLQTILCPCLTWNFKWKNAHEIRSEGK